MSLYLIPENSALLDRWTHAVSDYKPVGFKNLYDAVDGKSVLFVSDKIVSKIGDDQLRNLFEQPVMILAISPHFLEAEHYLQLGAKGYGNAMMHETHLKSAYQALREGKVWLHPDFISMLILQVRQHTPAKADESKRLELLSSREKEVAIMLGDGATHQQIAEALNITVRTVKAHATSIYHKLDVKDRLALSLYLHS